MGNGKSNPFNPNGRSGAVGNVGARPPIDAQTGGNPAQRSGSTRNPTTVAGGGPALKLDPPTDRGGVGTTAAPSQRRPFRLNGVQERSMPVQEDDLPPAGSVADDEADNDPSAEG
jgi:hypothetical protein